MTTFIYPLAALILSLSLIAALHYRTKRQAMAAMAPVNARRMNGRFK